MANMAVALRLCSQLLKCFN
ncbi:hypothetical protein CCACVL1_00200 [Corchorus capsularis]|uniref:Uncharacterized protein n=1 Tax=Corchorus capsularis TaxID=210143 RepID=A0A1R3KXZ9_COCAP|nr:hypothetical protein CCACVL1_00200 [Corchorus capsularis]